MTIQWFDAFELGCVYGGGKKDVQVEPEPVPTGVSCPGSIGYDMEGHLLTPGMEPYVEQPPFPGVDQPPSEDPPPPPPHVDGP